MDLVKWLTQKQQELGLSDDAFGQVLHLAPSHLSLLRSGKRRPSLLVVRNAVGAFPECRDIIISLALDITTGNDDITKGMMEVAV